MQCPTIWYYKITYNKSKLFSTNKSIGSKKDVYLSAADILYSLKLCKFSTLLKLSKMNNTKQIVAYFHCNKFYNFILQSCFYYCNTFVIKKPYFKAWLFYFPILLNSFINKNAFIFSKFKI